ncbi:MAG: hypothetical protein IJW99_11920, partial [Clostridia bacterium]|nr:hypothetical protein [Clostridia bacterium]
SWANLPKANFASGTRMSLRDFAELAHRANSFLEKFPLAGAGQSPAFVRATIPPPRQTKI